MDKDQIGMKRPSTRTRRLRPRAVVIQKEAVLRFSKISSSLSPVLRSTFRNSPEDTHETDDRVIKLSMFVTYRNQLKKN